MQKKTAMKKYVKLFEAFNEKGSEPTVYVLVDEYQVPIAYTTDRAAAYEMEADLLGDLEMDMEHDEDGPRDTDAGIVEMDFDWFMKTDAKRLTPEQLKDLLDNGETIHVD